MSNMTGVHGLPFGVGSTAQIPIFNRPTPVIDPKREHETPKNAVNYYGDFGGCGWWRMQLPEMQINFSKSGVVTGLHKLIPDEAFYSDIRSVRLQRQASPKHAEFLDHIKKISNKYGFSLIYEIDDIIFKDDIPDFNKAKVAFNSDEILNSTLKMMNSCDVLSVTCEYMRDYYAQHLDHDNIEVIPNMPSKMWFDNYYSSQNVMKNFDDNKNRPRILYAGSGNHFDVDEKGLADDFTHVKDAIINSRKEFKWVFLGSIPRYLHQYVRSGEIEFHPWTIIMNYPKMISQLNINAVVAPLMDCTFNKAKSNIKYLESACLGIPGVFQDLITYKEAPLKFTDGDDMINKLHKLLSDRKYYAKLSKQSRTYADKMWLDDNIDMYTDLYYN